MHIMLRLSKKNYVIDTVMIVFQEKCPDMQKTLRRTDIVNIVEVASLISAPIGALAYPLKF